MNDIGEPSTVNTADETDSGAAAARDTECGAEEGISTSGERGEGAKPVPRGAEEGISTSGESGKHLLLIFTVRCPNMTKNAISQELFCF